MQIAREQHAAATTAAETYVAATTRSAVSRGTLAAPRQVRPASVPQTLEDHVLKRGLDILVALVMLVLFSPVMLIAALLIRLESGGPVFFRQKRVGLGGKVFEIVKFRTMRVMEDGDAAIQASQDDARITRVGAWLRRTSLDEVPQFLNVLFGDMSIVGPRPHATGHDRYYTALIEDYALRHRVKPGITGWAQIHGLRGATPTVEIMQERVRFDVWYTQHASVALDFEIMLRTPYAILLQRNAY